MKNSLITIVIILSSLSLANGQYATEVGIFSGMSFNSTPVNQSKFALGAQTGLRVKVPIYKHIYVLTKVTVREMSFRAIDSYNYLDLNGRPRFGFRSVLDNYQTMDFSLIAGAELLSHKWFSLNATWGFGRGIILNAKDYENNLRLSGLNEYYNFSEIGFEFRFAISRNMALIVDTQNFHTSFYSKEYGENNSFLLDAHLTYLLSSKSYKMKAK